MVELDHGTVVSCVSGPKRPHDKVAVADMHKDFKECLGNKVGFKGFGLPVEKHKSEVELKFEGDTYKMSHGRFRLLTIIYWTMFT